MQGTCDETKINSSITRIQVLPAKAWKSDRNSTEHQEVAWDETILPDTCTVWLSMSNQYSFVPQKLRITCWWDSQYNKLARVRSARFSEWDSAQRFGACTSALKKPCQIYKSDYNKAMPTLSNKQQQSTYMYNAKKQCILWQ